MDESQPRQQQNPNRQQQQHHQPTPPQPQQPQSQQSQQSQPTWTRSRLTADGQTSRRPRAVAGQRAAAKRAAGQRPVTGQPTQPNWPAQAVPPVRDDQPPLPEPREPADSLIPDSEAPKSRAPELATPASATPELEPTESEPTESAVTESAVTDPAAVDHDAAEPAEPADPADFADPADAPRSVRRAIVTAVLAVALIAALAVGTVLTIQYRTAIRTDHARTAATAEAERAAPVIFSYDYRHLDRDFSKAEAYLTGSFRDQYAKTTQTVVKPTALQYHGVVQATVAKPADGSAAAVSVVSATPDQVVVLAFIDQSTTSTRVNGTQVDQNRVLLTLTHTPQGWRVSAVDAL